MNATLNYELTDLSQFTGQHYQGLDFCEEIHIGLPVLARSDLPKLRFNNDACPAKVQEEVSKWNQLFAAHFQGAGYYAPSQEVEDLLSNNVFVLFADDVFYDAFLGGTAVSEVILDVPVD